MPTREDLLAVLLARRQLRSIRPILPGPSADWREWLDSGWRLRSARGPARAEIVAIMAARPPDPPSPVPRELGRWQRWRGLFDVGWDPRNRTPSRLRYSALAASVLVNLGFVAFLLASLYLRFGPDTPPEEETVRIRITGFGTPDESGGGDAPAEGEAAPAAQAREGRPAPAPASAATPSGAPPSEAATTTQAEPAPEAEADAVAIVDQPLQVSEPRTPEESTFRLPPPRELSADVPQRATLHERALPSEASIPGPLPEVRQLDVPSVRPSEVRSVDISERSLPEPVEAPRVAMRQLEVRVAANPGLREQPLQSRELPGVPAGTGSESAGSSRGTSAANDRPAGEARPQPGLPGAAGRADRPGQAAPAPGVGPGRTVAERGWPAPVRGDDWGAGERNRAGQAAGGDRGSPQGSGGNRLVGADGRPRLSDDRFQPRIPDPYREGTWLKRPGLAVRGTMFNGIWRPPETLLQEWVRQGVRSFDIPLPGGKVKIRCVISVLQAGGGCLPVAGKEGVHDQPARARPAPTVPFKPELFENPDDLGSGARPEASAGDESPR